MTELVPILFHMCTHYVAQGGFALMILLSQCHVLKSQDYATMPGSSSPSISYAC